MFRPTAAIDRTKVAPFAIVNGSVVTFEVIDALALGVTCRPEAHKQLITWPLIESEGFQHKVTRVRRGGILPSVVEGNANWLVLRCVTER
jgi:hypothetical protein